MIRKLALSVCTATLLVAQPASAGSLVDNVGPAQGRIGMFAGARMKLSLGGVRRDPVRAGLTLTSTRTLARADGRVRTLYGEGLEFGFAGGKSATFSLAGQPLGRNNGRRNVSTVGAIAIATGALVVAGGIGFLILLHEAEKNSD